MKQAVVAFLALTLTCTAVVQARQQVVKNGSFESLDSETGIPVTWNRFGAADPSTLLANDGVRSILTDVSEGAFVGLYQDTGGTARENTHILAKALAWVPADAVFQTDTSPNGVAGIKLEFRAAGGAGLPPAVENLAFDQTSPNNEWVPVSLTTTVPEGVERAKITIISFEEDNSIVNGSLRVDDVSVLINGSPFAITNPSFEDGPGGPNGLTGWTEFGGGLNSAQKSLFNSTPPNQAHSGINVLRIDILDDGAPAEAVAAGVQQAIGAIPGDEMTVQAFFFSRSVSPYGVPSGLARAGVKVEWAAGGLPTPGQVDVIPNGAPGAGVTNVVNNDSPRDQWVPVTVDYTMAENTAADIRATVINAFGAGNCQVSFDSFEIVFTNVFDGSDVDGDNDEDMNDIAFLQTTFTGSGGGMEYPGLVYDHDDDGDVDSSDANFTLARITGPATP